MQPASNFLAVKGMPSAGRLAAVIMSTLVKASVAFRVAPHIGRESRVTQLHTLQRSFRCCNYTTSRPRPPSMLLLGGEAGIGIVGISAVGAIRLLTANLVRKRVRVVTDIDDTVKSSGNKRLLGVPLGGIDAQCETPALIIRALQQVASYACVSLHNNRVRTSVASYAWFPYLQPPELGTRCMAFASRFALLSPRICILAVFTRISHSIVSTFTSMGYSVTGCSFARTRYIYNRRLSRW